MTTTSIASSTVNLRKSRISASLFLTFLLSDPTYFSSPKALWFGTSNKNSQSIFSGVMTCHSFTIEHPWSTTALSKRSARKETSRKIAATFLQARDGESSDNLSEDGFTNASIEEIQQLLAEKGIAFTQTSLQEEPSMTRVPGCVSTVHIVAKQETNTSKIIVYGHSDALISRGLLSLLKDYLQQLTLDQILHMEPMDVADILGVRPALSKGRNDGLSNMLKIIQTQLKNDNFCDDNQAEKTNTLMNSSKVSLSSHVEKKPTVALLLSGGVDSSVAFRLLLEQGYDVTPFYLKIWLEDELAHLGECPWEDDVHTCRQVCDQVGIDLQIIGLQDEYHQRVMQHTLNEASLGRTPNPDILCNSRVKFGCFLEYINGLPNQFDYIASGHYAQVKRTTSHIDKNDNDVGTQAQSSSIARLFRAPDPVKDQSYFLCALNQSQLSRLIFPIGHLEKIEVRQLADDFQLPNRHRPDSQGLCFLGKVKFRDFMQIHLGEKVGDLVDAMTGEIIGQHHGVWYHTVGQRKGIGPYLVPKATARGPWYVVAKDPSKNIVYASNKYDEDVFVQARSEFHVENLHWISGEEPLHLLDENEGMYRFIFKIRHGPKLAAGTLKVVVDEEEENGVENKTANIRNGGIIKLDDKDGGLAPGQYVVFYTEDSECLGGGIISERHWAKFLLGTKSRSKAATAK